MCACRVTMHVNGVPLLLEDLVNELRSIETRILATLDTCGHWLHQDELDAIQRELEHLQRTRRRLLASQADYREG